MAACVSPPTHWSIPPRPVSFSPSPSVMRSNRVYWKWTCRFSTIFLLRICALMRVRWSSPRNSRRWSCWAAPIFVVLAGYHWRGYLRALAHAVLSVRADLPDKVSHFCSRLDEQEGVSPAKKRTAAGFLRQRLKSGEKADVPVCQRRRAERLRRSGGTVEQIVLLRFGTWYSGSSSPGSQIWCRDSPRLPQGHLPNRSRTPSFLRKALREAQAHDD